MTAATAGLSALLVSSSVAFTAVKIAGAVYLVGLGLWTLLSRRPEAEVALGGERNLRRAFAQGIVVNVLNPKTALFFLAFLPQFVDPDASHPAVQIAVLGLLFAVLGLVTDSLWAVAAGTAGGVLRRSRRFLRTQRYVAGTVYVGLGVVTAFAGSSSDE
jgi:threonine/homoserine/homoserine lactone efflux protein